MRAGSLLRRAVSSLVLVWLLLTVVFFLLHAAPGKPSALLATSGLSPEQRAGIERAYGLDRSLPEQYLRWLGAIVLDGNWGVSFTHRRPVLELLVEAFPATALLSLSALLFHLLASVGGALLAARRKGSWLDRGVQTVSLLGFSLPVFWLGLMAILVFASWWPLFPTGHLRSPGASGGGLSGLADVAWHLILPSLVLGGASCGGTLRLVRASLIDALDQDYVRAARAKGVSQRRVLTVHALRNALPGLAQVVGMALPALLNGSLVIEVIFSWPGVGRLLFEAIQSSDYPLVLAGTALSGVLVVLGSFLADLAHAWVDPRVRDA
ncbi:MAG TPA: ABC transporter permease [Thermoanaerobaculia bacterium]|nr:ABC transporter permease [Thermoanaerobaculia bacterium]